jgi:hypothetical protein
MKKTLIPSLILILSTFFVYAGEWVEISSRDQSPAEISLISSDYRSSRISFEIPGFELIEVQTEQGPASLLFLEDATPLLEAGSPDLLKLTASVSIPDLAGMDVRVLSSDYTDYENILIAPSKGNLTRDIDPSEVPYTFGNAYARDAFFPGELVSLRDPFIIRDYRGQTVVAYPFQYNPATRTLRVYHSMDVEIFKVNDNGVNPLVRDHMPKTISREYAPIYDLHFLNKPQNLADYTPVSEHGNMLIISYGDFIPAMQPLVDWRIQTGTPVEIVDVATIGGSAQIKNYIADYYNTNGLTFVLLVGDAAQIPPSYSSGDSDNDYAYIVGNDHYPDLFIGRFSAENIGHVETQVERTINYEKDPYLDFDWFTRGVGIASSQGPGDDGEYDYQHIRNIHTDLTDFTYTYTAELFDGSQGGNDAPGNPTPSMVATELNTGASIINYTGHGSTTSWGSSGFSNSNVNNLTNDGMLPFIWSVACVNGNFVGNTCFAEAWLRATNDGAPSGAVATMMSTINQSWNPPMCGQDEMVDVLVETYPDNINRTFGAASMHGCMQMNDEYGSAGDEMTDTWVCFGDPSLHVRTAFPQDIVASYMPTLLIGMSSFEITCDANGGTACLSEDGTILATGTIEGGSVTLSFPELTEMATLTLTITAFNYIPLIDEIDVVPGNMPFLVFENDHVVDPDGNNNGNLDYGESVTYTIDLHNLGGMDAVDVDVTLEASDPYVTVTDDFEVYDLIPAGQTVGVPEGFALEVAEDVPDGHMVDFTVTATDSDTTWIMEYQAMVAAPILNIGKMVIDDATSGNDNGRLDPGETATIKVENYNTGHCPAENTVATLFSDCHYLTFTNNTFDLNTLYLIGAQWSEFEVSVDEDAPDGAALAYFDYELASGDMIEYASFQEKIGLIFEDWETGDFNLHEWVHGGDMPFELTNIYPYEGDFSAKSGSIEDNEESILKIDVEVMLADSVTFIYKLSSQLNQDYLKFYINNSLKGEWSGMGQGWQRVAIPVEPGNYTFKWIYAKDDSGMTGSDCAWLDFITFPPLMTLTCYAGPDESICEGDDFQCQGQATDWVNLTWSSSGDGSFDDPNILEPVYTPGSDDMDNGTVYLTLTAEDADGAVVDDEMMLMVLGTPETPAMPEGPDYVNLNDTTTSEYTVEPVPYAEYYEWKVEPANAGTIYGMGTTGTIDWNTSFLGTAAISARAMNSCDEGEFSQELVVTVDNFTGLDEVVADNSFSLWPNPNNGNFNIEVSVEKAGNYVLRAYSLLGKEMAIRPDVFLDGNTTFTVDFSTLPEGLYFVVIEGQGEKMIRKLIMRK